MIGAGDGVLVGILALLGVACMASALRSLGPLRRVLRDQTRAVRDVVAGPVELAGTLRAVDGPVFTLGGVAAVAVERVLGYSYKSPGGNKTFVKADALVQHLAATVELRDATDACAVEMDGLLLIAPSRAQRFGPHDFATRFPAVWAELTRGIESDVVRAVHVRETFVPDGVAGFVSGEAVVDDTLVPAEDYRGVRQRWRVRGHADRPLVLCAWDERGARRYLARPALVLAWCAALCWLTAAGVVLLERLAAGAAGLG